MKDLSLECAETFLEKQGQLFDEPVAYTIEEAMDFLEDMMALTFDSAEEIREYWDDNGMDTEGMSDEEILEASEVFELPCGKYLVVEG